MSKKIFYLLSIYLAFLSCNPIDKFQNISEVKYEPGIAFPLINTDFNIREVLGKYNDGRYIDTLSDGTIAVVYRGKVFSVGGENVYTFSNQTNIPIPFNNTEIPFNSIIGQNFKEVIFKNGTIILSVNNIPNMFLTDMTCTVTFNNLKTNNQALSKTFIIPKNTSNTTTIITNNIVLDNTILDMPIGKIFITYTLNGQNIPFPNANLSFSLKDIKYSYIEGKIPQYQFSLSEKIIELDIFKYWKLGDIYFKDPRINIIVANSYGVPIEAKADVLNAIAANGIETNITNTAYPNNIFNFPYPTLSQAGMYAIDTFKFSTSNSNLSNVIQSRPPQVKYKVSALLNPNEIDGFITDTSKFDVYVDISLPMYGHAKDYTLTKDFDTDLSMFSAMNYANFKLVTENGFPADIKLQLFFLSANDNIIDSLFIDNPIILNAADVDASGRVNQANKVTTINHAEFSPQRFSAIKTAKKIKLRGSLNTLNNGTTDVKFYTDYAMGIRLGIIAGVNPLEIIK
ncbi:MAG: hypothetical protein ACRCZI_14245 [Cetobacterium sp.]